MDDRGVQEGGITMMPLAIFALFLLVPFLEFEFTFYTTTLKLLAFQTAVTVLWCHLAHQWATGGLRAPAAPAWWLFAPVGLWVAWGCLTTLWSARPGLATGWLVQDLYGLAGALGLALLLREREPRRMFVQAVSVVAFAVAAIMIASYDRPTGGFFADRDLAGRDVGAAFILLPTLVAAAALYGRTADQGKERDYRGVIWSTALLVVLLVAGLRTGRAAWAYALGIGLAVAVWQLIPRWRLAALLLVGVVAAAVVYQEARRAEMGRGEFVDTRPYRHARLDRADWSLWQTGTALEKLAGRGIGSFVLAYDHHRPLATYAASRGDALIGHARRQLTEALFERGVIGVLLAALVGAAAALAGVVCARRARDGLDAAVAAGMAAGVVGLWLFACLSAGGVALAGAFPFWMGLGLLGSLTSLHGRAAALSYSAEEEASLAERRPRRRALRLVPAMAVAAAAVAVWFLLGVRPFVADYRLREGVQEHEATLSLMRQYRAHKRQLDYFSRDQLQYLALRRRADREAAPSAELAQTRARLSARQVGEVDVFFVNEREAERNAMASAERTHDHFDRAAALSHGGRVWLTAQINLLRFAIDRLLFNLDRGKRADRGELREAVLRLQSFCGHPFGTVDVYHARLYLGLAQRAIRQARRLRGQGARQLAAADLRAAVGFAGQAHQLFHRYARKNPFAAKDALGLSNIDIYEDWYGLIENQLRLGDPRAGRWARDLDDAVSRALRIDRGRYKLLAYRGGLLFHRRRVEEAHTDWHRAVLAIEAELASRPYSPEVTAKLLVDAALIVAPLDPEAAAGFAISVATLRLDLEAPANLPIKNKSRMILERLGIRPPRGLHPPGGPPPARAPARGRPATVAPPPPPRPGAAAPGTDSPAPRPRSGTRPRTGAPAERPPAPAPAPSTAARPATASSPASPGRR